MYSRPAVILWGDFGADRAVVESVAEGFGWAVHGYEPGERYNAVAVLIDAWSGDWRDRVRAAGHLLPGVPVILARGFDPGCCDCDPERDGVFDVLLKPIHPGECRQSLGFVEQRLARNRRRLHAVHAA
jgi:hypothetical protein